MNFSDNQIYFYIFFTAFIFLIFYQKKYNLDYQESFENCSVEDCSKKSDALKEQIQNSNTALSNNNIQTEINQIKNTMVDNKRNLEIQINELGKKVDRNTMFIDKVKKEIKKIEDMEKKEAEKSKK